MAGHLEPFPDDVVRGSRPELGRSFRGVGSRWGCGCHRLAAPSADGNAHGRHLIRPSGSLGRRDAGGDHVDAALRHGRTRNGVPGAASRARPLLGQRRAKLGDRRGAQRPLASRNVKRCVCRLSHLTVAQVSPAEPPKTPLRAPPGTTPTEPSRASSSASRSRASRSERATGDPSALARSAARPRSALPIPLGHRRSSILDEPTARRFPEMPPERPEMVSWPGRGV